MDHQNSHGNAGDARPLSARFTPEAFAMLGAPDLAYIRPVQTQMGPAFGIFAANGQHVGLAESVEKAFLAARQNDLAPVHVQ
jgi:hypothetical protein